MKSLINPLITIATIACLSACSSSKIPLSAKEINFVKTWENNFISLNYDKKAIKENRINGIYKVVYSIYNTSYGYIVLCGKDTNYTKQQAYYVATAVKKIMAYKKNHHFIDVIISGDGKDFPRNIEGEIIACSYTIRVDVSSLQSKIISSYSNQDVISGLR